MLKIENLKARVEGEEKLILKGVSLDVKCGEIHAIMGPNGSGKSTLGKVLAGHPEYEITEGDISFEGEDITELDADERARKGLFLAFQYPVEIPGVTNKTLLRSSYNAIAKERNREELDPLEFEDYINEKLKKVQMDPLFLQRSVNTGFSGGEKKRNEIFQMLVLDPIISILDETDSGLDVDALRIVAKGIKSFSSPKHAVVLITHYQRLLNYVEPDIVHVMMDGKIIHSGDKNLALELDSRGYDWVSKQ